MANILTTVSLQYSCTFETAPGTIHFLGNLYVFLLNLDLFLIFLPLYFSSTATNVKESLALEREMQIILRRIYGYHLYWGRLYLLRTVLGTGCPV
jgi:hypothetical protein